ncbi:MAG: amidase family protein [Gemmatimonadota bacterium]
MATTTSPLSGQASGVPDTDLSQASIEGIHQAMLAGKLTARALVELCLARIDAYDDRGPTLHAISLVNRGARARADSLDALFRRRGLTGPLHGIPVVVKDNIDVAGMRTSAGSGALTAFLPTRDAEVVARLHAAGAVILARSNMAEFALSSTETVSSSMPGRTYNPYALNRTPGGSSGGSAAAVAAGYAPVALGTDTGSSIRGPAAWTSLVGLRPSFGLVSRQGVFPLYRDRDTVGPLTRTVRDAALMLEVMAGPDPDDPSTAETGRYSVKGAVEGLHAGALAGVRVGVLRSLAAPRDTDPDVLVLFELALIDLRRAGAVIVDSVTIPGMHEGPLACERFQRDVDAYFGDLGAYAPFASFADLLARGRLDGPMKARLAALERGAVPEEDGACRAAHARLGRLRTSFEARMAERDLDVLVNPTWRHPPPLVADAAERTGNASHFLAVPLGLPAITVPMGFARGSLPAGLHFVGAPWSDAALLGYAYAYEQATLHRRPPASTPALVPGGSSAGAPGWGAGSGS